MTADTERYVRALVFHRKAVEAALEHSGGTHSFHDVVEEAKAGRVQVWFTPRSIMVTELQQHPQKKVLLIFLAAGERAEVRRMASLIEAWAKEQGCSSSTFIGRRGWSRTEACSVDGYTPRLYVYEKAL